MRRASFDKNSSSTKRNIVNSEEWYRAHSSARKDVDYKSLSYNSQASNNNLQRSVSADNVVIRSRGFKPSDRHDPAKRHFLESLTSKILHFEMDSGEVTPINLQKLLTPAMDTTELLTRNKKMYASSCFYAPTHPTVEDQVELARRISYSLSDVKNMKSKGQSMYVNRKKRSVKWIHDGNGDEDEEEPSSPIHKDKLPLKCMMNPNGKVMDIHGIQALGEEVNVGTSPMNAEKLFDIVRDLNNQKGRGAEIFAKRRKRSEKWVVDKEQCQSPSTPGGFGKTPNFPNTFENGANENSKFTSLPPLTNLPTQTYEPKPFYNPFTLDLSLESLPPPKPGNDQRRGSLLSDSSSGKYVEIKKVYLREIAVGTEPECPIGIEDERAVAVEKSKRMMSFDSSSNNNDHRNGNRRTKSSSINGGSNNYSNNYSKQEMSNGRENNNYSRRVSDRHAHPHSHHQHHHHHNHHHQQYPQYQYRDQAQQMGEEMTDETEYTPVPVKQLIQEFEKTCRPTLQYKQISPKVIPIVQQCPPLDNDLSRFFESSQHQQAPRSSVNGNNVMPKRNGNPPMKMSNGSSNNNNVNYNGNGNGYGPKLAYGGQPIQNVMGQSVRYEEYDSSEDEIDDSFGDSGSELNYRRADLSDMYDDGSHNYTNGNGTRPVSNGTIDEYEMYVRQFDESNQLFEAPPGFRNGDVELCPNKATNGNTDPNSMVLAMVASQEEIRDTKKHLRNTPVLENLVGAPSPHFIADVGNDKVCESSYQGPKIASYQTLTNYNTAPRGWDQTQTFYRPVTFGKQQEPIAYSDF